MVGCHRKFLVWCSFQVEPTSHSVEIRYTLCAPGKMYATRLGTRTDSLRAGYDSSIDFHPIVAELMLLLTQSLITFSTNERYERRPTSQ